MLNDRERTVRQCIIMRLKEPEALAYCKGHGQEMSKATYWRIRGQLQATKLKRLYEIGQAGFEDQHLWRIDQLELIEQEMWKCYHLEQSPFRKAKILKDLADIQPYLATFYDLTRKVIENKRPEQANNSLPELTESGTN